VSCANNTGTDNASSSQVVTQGDTKSQLAETGAGETVFLLVGAATMIAGGIGFRLMPRLVAGRGNIAA
jgi:LPXTG-motif cell wall-anchored protein